MAHPSRRPVLRSSAAEEAVLLAAVALVALALADARRFVDPDLFMNLFAARDMVAAGGLPGVDTHSFAASDLPWVDYEWLARLIQYGVYLGGGGPALVVLRLLQAAACVGLLLLAARRAGASVPACAVALLLAWPAVAHFFLLRARAFSFVMFALTLALAVELRRGGGGAARWTPWAAPPLILLWVNLHGAWLLGLALVAAVLAEGLLQPRGRTAAALARAAAVLLACVAVTFAHPAGGGVVAAVTRTATGTAAASISEWQPVWEHELRATASYLALIPVAAAVAAWQVVRRRMLAWPAMLVGLAVQTILHVRFGALLGLALVPALAPALDAVLASVRRPSTAVLRRVSIAAAVPCAVGVLWSSGHRDLNLRMDPEWTPVAAVRFMDANHIGGRVLAEFDWGAYVIWALPDARVFIDGRWDTVYPPEIDEAWSTFARFQPGWERVLRDSGATAVLLRHERGAPARFRELADWGLVYTDDHADLLLRGCPENADFLRRLRAGQVLPPPPVTDADLVLE